jgi:hypothetical protein
MLTPGPHRVASLRARRLLSIGCGLATMLALSLVVGRARACGPCTVPELWDVQRIGSELSVVTNFGLLSQRVGTCTLTSGAPSGGNYVKESATKTRPNATTNMGL